MRVVTKGTRVVTYRTHPPQAVCMAAKALAVLQVLGTVLDRRDRSATSTVLDMFHNYITNL